MSIVLGIKMKTNRVVKKQSENNFEIFVLQLLD